MFFAVCLRFRSCCQSWKSEEQISSEGRGSGGWEGSNPQGGCGGCGQTGLALVEQLFSSISSLRVLKLQKSYLVDHGGIALSSVFSFLN